MDNKIAMKAPTVYTNRYYIFISQSKNDKLTRRRKNSNNMCLHRRHLRRCLHCRRCRLCPHRRHHLRSTHPRCKWCHRLLAGARVACALRDGALRVHALVVCDGICQAVYDLDDGIHVAARDDTHLAVRGDTLRAPHIHGDGSHENVFLAYGALAASDSVQQTDRDGCYDDRL